MLGEFVLIGHYYLSTEKIHNLDFGGCETGGTLRPFIRWNQSGCGLGGFCACACTDCSRLAHPHGRHSQPGLLFSPATLPLKGTHTPWVKTALLWKGYHRLWPSSRYRAQRRKEGGEERMLGRYMVTQPYFSTNQWWHTMARVTSVTQNSWHSELFLSSGPFIKSTLEMFWLWQTLTAASGLPLFYSLSLFSSWPRSKVPSCLG